MPAWFWIVVGAVLVAVLFGGKGNPGKRRGGVSSGRAVRVERPHVIEDTDYECSVCGSRFSEAASVCPCCGARFEGKQKDWEEFDLEEDELEAWDEEDGV